ncbi:MAG: PepSY domain-containing protein [Eubacteriales bacterium]|nr:PepSY domain-containing protein [Eubacteriales bacterium]
MKKRISLLLALLLLLPFSFALSQSGSLTLEQAKTAALQAAGLSTQEVSILKACPEQDDGYDVYEITLLSGDQWIELTIDCATGRVVDQDTERMKNPSAFLEANNNAATGAYIGLEAAVAATLTQAQLQKEQTEDLYAWVDEEDDMPVYQVRFTYDNQLYESHVNAVNGKVEEKNLLQMLESDR